MKSMRLNKLSLFVRTCATHLRDSKSVNLTFDQSWRQIGLFLARWFGWALILATCSVFAEVFVESSIGDSSCCLVNSESTNLLMCDDKINFDVMVTEGGETICSLKHSNEASSINLRGDDISTMLINALTDFDGDGSFEPSIPVIENDQGSFIFLDSASYCWKVAFEKNNDELTITTVTEATFDPLLPYDKNNCANFKDIHSDYDNDNVVDWQDNCPCVVNSDQVDEMSETPAGIACECYDDSEQTACLYGFGDILTTCEEKATVRKNVMSRSFPCGSIGNNEFCFALSFGEHAGGRVNLKNLSSGANFSCVSPNSCGFVLGINDFIRVETVSAKGARFSNWGQGCQIRQNEGRGWTMSPAHSGQVR